MDEILNQKTIFVLNHTSDMLRTAKEISIDNRKSDVSNNATPTFKKSIWSCCVESVLEYVRIIYDLFQTDRPLALIIIDSEEKILTICNDKNDQYLSVWQKHFYDEGPPPANSGPIDMRYIPALDSVKNVLELVTSETVSGRLKHGVNAGRVMFLGFEMRESAARYQALIDHSLATVCLDMPQFALVEHSEWIFIDIVPSNSNSPFLTDYPEPLLPDCTSPHRLFAHTVRAVGGGGPANTIDLHRALMHLAEAQHQLACTVVQNIPMKEESSATNSSFYGVELLHHREAHAQLRHHPHLERLVLRKPQCGFSSALGIKWVTPKSTDANCYFNSAAVFKATTSDICNRAAVCLAQFVLEGRFVSLELPHDTQSNNKAASSSLVNQNGGISEAYQHELPAPRELLLLSSHSSVLYLHALRCHRNPLIRSAPPTQPHATPQVVRRPISDAPGSDVTKYRLDDFVQLIQNNLLAPAASHAKTHTHRDQTPRAHSQSILEAYTRYWPLTMSDTLICQKANLKKLFELLPMANLEEVQFNVCCAMIREFLNHEITNKKSVEGSTARAEFEHLLLMHRANSPLHSNLHNYYLELSKKAGYESALAAYSGPIGLPLVDKFHQARIAQQAAADNNKKMDATTTITTAKIEKNSHLQSQQHSANQIKLIKTNISLADILENQTAAEINARKRPLFDPARLNAEGVPVLYPQLEKPQQPLSKQAPPPQPPSSKPPPPLKQQAYQQHSAAPSAKTN